MNHSLILGELTIDDFRLTIQNQGSPHARFSIVNRQSKIVNYSYLNATIGSTFVARRAGRYVAPIDTRASTAETVTKVTGSVAPTPNNKLDKKRENAMAAASPIPTPASVRI